VDVDDDGRLFLLVVLGQREECGNLPPVEALDVNQLRRLERLAWDPRGRRIRPPCRLAGVELDDVDVRIHRSAVGGDCVPIAIGEEVHAAGHATRKLRSLGLLDRRRSVERAGSQLGVSVDISRVDQASGVLVECNAADVPGAFVADVPFAPGSNDVDIARLDVDPDEFECVRVLVGTAVDPLARWSPLGTGIANLVGVDR